MSIYIMVCYFLLIVLLMICVHLIKCSREVISYRALLEEETVLAIAFLQRIGSELKTKAW